MGLKGLGKERKKRENAGNLGKEGKGLTPHICYINANHLIVTRILSFFTFITRVFPPVRR